jgi:hypothetical protein
MIEDTLEIHDSTIALEKMDVPYHGMQNIIFLTGEHVEYLKWYSEDNTALGFQFNCGALKDTFVYILRDSIKISENGVSFKHEVIRNPHNVDKSVFETDEFYDVLSKAMNDVVAEMLEWKRETHDA